MKIKNVPLVILESPDFQELSPLQARHLEGRFDYISEIQNDMSEWLSQGAERNVLKHFLDDIELNIGEALNSSSDPKEGLSAWLLHSTWAAAVIPMRIALDDDIVRLIDEAVPNVDASTTDFLKWLDRQATGLATLLTLFRSATTFAVAMAAAIAIDIQLANLLVALYKARLNRHIQEEPQ